METVPFWDKQTHASGLEEDEEERGSLALSGQMSIGSPLSSSIYRINPPLHGWLVAPVSLFTQR
jgi:hypothetical protein